MNTNTDANWEQATAPVRHSLLQKLIRRLTAPTLIVAGLVAASLCAERQPSRDQWPTFILMFGILYAGLACASWWASHARNFGGMLWRAALCGILIVPAMLVAVALIDDLHASAGPARIVVVDLVACAIAVVTALPSYFLRPRAAR